MEFGTVADASGHLDYHNSPFLDFGHDLDENVPEYVARVRFTIIKDVEYRLGIDPWYQRKHPNNPVHPNVIALKRLAKKSTPPPQPKKIPVQRDRPWLHLHSGTDAVLNVTFLRAPSSALLKVEVPLVFRGEDVCPGLRKGAYLNTIKRTVKYLCPADIIPPYIDVDLSELDVGEKLVMQDLKVHPALQLLHPASHPICNIIGSRAPEQKKSK